MQLYKVVTTNEFGKTYTHTVVALNALTAHTRTMVARRKNGNSAAVVGVTIERICEVNEIAPDVLAALRAKPSKRRKGAGGAK